MSQEKGQLQRCNSIPFSDNKASCIELGKEKDAMSEAG